jgi:hypothetical protein
MLEKLAERKSGTVEIRLCFGDRLIESLSYDYDFYYLSPNCP